VLREALRETSKVFETFEVCPFDTREMKINVVPRTALSGLFASRTGLSGAQRLYDLRWRNEGTPNEHVIEAKNLPVGNHFWRLPAPVFAGIDQRLSQHYAENSLRLFATETQSTQSRLF